MSTIPIYSLITIIINAIRLGIYILSVDIDVHSYDAHMIVYTKFIALFSVWGYQFHFDLVMYTVAL